MKKLLVFAFALLVVGEQDPEPRVRAELAAARQMPAAMAARVQPVIDQAWAGFDPAAAMAQVEFASRYWRLAGNEGYDATLDRVRARLEEVRSPGASAPGNLFVETAATPSPGWDYTVGTLALIRPNQPDLVVLSKERERVALAINSISTDGKIDAPLVDVGRGQAGDFEGKDLKGAVVIGDADLGTLFRQAVTQRGALGAISTSIAKYIADDPDVLQWGSIPLDATRKAFGFKASRRAATTLREALKAGPQRVRVEVASTFANKPERTLVYEIPGRTLPNERVVLAAHIQEPGANDNASGVATLMELARSLGVGVASGRIPPPARTITFLWLNEISGSRAWIARHPDLMAGVRYMFSMDMTGEDVAKTGGSFLVERWPDPGAVWARPWDPHSEWGAGNVRANTLKGDLINDLHLAVCELVAKKTTWVVKTNPYEGGSDHTVFGSAGVPSLLNWHFTDRYYHSSLDTPDKTSPEEMRNVGVAMASSAWVLASADEAMSLQVAELVASAGRARLAVELRDGSRLTDHAAALAAWRKWSAEAVRSVTRLVTVPVSPALTARIEALVAPYL
ncbi:MAG TPA: M28 family peptidase [Vicinamibacterales bacterium]|nr:M28 family peptidase [Vicinamibacterales bacterium]